jgi:hypothetical protein
VLGEFLKKYIFGPMPFYFFQHIYKQCILLSQQHCYDFPSKPYTSAGIEPGSAVPQADVMPTAPRSRDFLKRRARHQLSA